MYVYVSISRGARILFYTDFPSLSARGLTARAERAIMSFSGLRSECTEVLFTGKDAFSRKRKRSEKT